MLIFGSRTKLLSNQNNTVRFDCPHCHSRQTVQAFQSFKYFHVFWIPMFAYAKRITTQCLHCKQVRFEKALSETDIHQLQFAFDGKIPRRYYFGLMAAVLLVLSILIGVVVEKRAMVRYAENPLVGDVDQIRLNDHEPKSYVLYQVKHVGENSVIVEVGTQETIKYT